MESMSGDEGRLGGRAAKSEGEIQPVRLPRLFAEERQRRPRYCVGNIWVEEEIESLDAPTS
jgi:hypothetical protein